MQIQMLVQIQITVQIQIQSTLQIPENAEENSQTNLVDGSSEANKI